MNILLIGNGFDLAHNLPTSYTDFLEFCKMIRVVYDVEDDRHADDVWTSLHLKIEKEPLKEKFYELIGEAVKESNWDRGEFVRTETRFDELYDLIEDNVWVEYFQANPMYDKENWIDFEREISKVVQSIDKDLFDENGEKMDVANDIYKLTDCFLNEKFKEYLKYNEQKPFLKTVNSDNQKSISYQKVIDILYSDLNKLIRALEIYLSEYVMNLECKLFSQDIKELNIDRVLSFNYTNTYEKIYDCERRAKYDFIHGEANIKKSIDTNNMVLGIDEYLPKKRRNKDVEFIAFKKFYQRICKNTGCKYKEWVDEIEQDENAEKRNLVEFYRERMSFEDFGNKNYLHIFGHSLDVTDRDVIKELILNDNVYTTIYYREMLDEKGNSDNGRNDLGQKIANLVKVIGQDELIKRTGGNKKTIEFKMQGKMGSLSSKPE